MPSIPNVQASNELYLNVAPYLVPSVAAAIAIVPVFYGFVVKSALQLGTPIPVMTPKEIFKSGIKAAPVIGVVVGTQIVIQSLVEKTLLQDLKNQKSDFKTMLASSFIVGSLSAPALAVFNGQTMGYTAKQTWKALNLRQTAAIVSRETSFLFSLRISVPTSEAMKQVFGDNKAVEYSSTFIAGNLGSLAGHPADTALTFWQKGKKVERLSQLMRGSLTKSMTVGMFSVLFQEFNKSLMPTPKLNEN